jgi:hypothetical protein
MKVFDIAFSANNIPDEVSIMANTEREALGLFWESAHKYIVSKYTRSVVVHSVKDSGIKERNDESKTEV